MYQETKYSKIISQLKKQKPEFREKEELTNDILREIRKTSEKESLEEKLIQVLFGWTRIPLIRISFATITLTLLFIFSFQQFIIANRISKLESKFERSVEAGEMESGQTFSQRIFINFLINKEESDSLTISTKDLETLLNSYKELYENYQRIKEAEIGLEQIPNNSKNDQNKKL